MSLLVSASIGLVVLSAGIVVFVGFLYKKGEINETPGDLQFANLKNIPGEDYVDLNIVKVGKTKTYSVTAIWAPSAGLISITQQPRSM